MDVPRDWRWGNGVYLGSKAPAGVKSNRDCAILVSRYPFDIGLRAIECDKLFPYICLAMNDKCPEGPATTPLYGSG